MISTASIYYFTGCGFRPVLLCQTLTKLMEKPVYESREAVKEAVIKMEKARLVLFNNGMLSQKYNKLLKKRIWKLVKINKIELSELLSVFAQTH